MTICANIWNNQIDVQCNELFDSSVIMNCSTSNKIYVTCKTKKAMLVLFFSITILQNTIICLWLIKQQNLLKWWNDMIVSSWNSTESRQTIILNCCSSQWNSIDWKSYSIQYILNILNWTVYDIIQFPVFLFQIKQWLHIYLQASQIVHVSFRPNKECLFFLNN